MGELEQLDQRQIREEGTVILTTSSKVQQGAYAGDWEREGARVAGLPTSVRLSTV